MENNMKYIKLYENWKYLKESHEESWEYEEYKIENEGDIEDAFFNAYEKVDFNTEMRTVNIDDYSVDDYYIEKNMVVDITLVHTGILILDDRYTEGDYLGFNSFENVGDLWDVYIATKRFGVIKLEKTYPLDHLEINKPYSSVKSFICEGHPSFKDDMRFLASIEDIFILKNCPALKRIGHLNFLQSNTTNINVFDISNNNILNLSYLPNELDVSETFDCSGNCILYGCPSIPSINNNGQKVDIKVYDNPWLEDPGVEDYEWDLEKCLVILKKRLDEKRISPQEVIDILGDKIDLLFRKDKISDGAAKILWGIVMDFYPNEVEKLYNNFKAVGNKIPPDFLARMKKYDHSEYRDSKLDSEWKEVF